MGRFYFPVLKSFLMETSVSSPKTPTVRGGLGVSDGYETSLPGSPVKSHSREPHIGVTESTLT